MFVVVWKRRKYYSLWPRIIINTREWNAIKFGGDHFIIIHILLMSGERESEWESMEIAYVLLIVQNHVLLREETNNHVGKIYKIHAFRKISTTIIVKTILIIWTFTNIKWIIHICNIWIIAIFINVSTFH